MADILGLIKKFGLKGGAVEQGENDVVRYGKNLKEFVMLESLDKEYGEAKEDVRETQKKLRDIEETITRIEQEKKEKEGLSENLYTEGKNFYEQGDYARAIERWYHVLDVNPQHKRASAAILDAKEKISREENARLEAQRAAEKKTKEAGDHFELGKKYYREKNYEQAIQEFETAIHIGGKNPEFFESLAVSEQRIKERDEAFDRERKEKLEKEHMIREHCLIGDTFFRDEKYSEAIQEWQKALMLDPESTVLQENVRRGETILREYRKRMEEKAREAEEKLRQIRELQLQGAKFAREHDYLRAISTWEHVMALDPSREDVYSDIRIAQKMMDEDARNRREAEEKERERLRLERAQKAREEEEKIKRDEEEKRARTEKIQTHYGKGLTFFQLQEFDKALSEWEIVISIDPAFDSISELVAQAGRKIEEIKKEEELKRHRAEEEKRGLLEEEKARTEQRERTVRETFEEGMRLSSSGSYEKALEKFHYALSLKREDEGIKREIAEIELKIEEREKKEAAEKKRQELLRMEEERRQLKMKLVFEHAQMYFEDGDYQKAIEEWTKILEMDFSHTEARSWIYKAEKIISDTQRKMALEEASRREKLETISRMNFEATQLFNDGHYEESIKMWTKVYDLDPLSIEAKQGILRAKQRMKEIEYRERARDLSKKIIEEQSSRLNYLRKLYEKGERMYQDGDFQQAMSEWEKLLEELKK
jgi:tetratricopeptide (TPR) repeat protein